MTKQKQEIDGANELESQASSLEAQASSIVVKCEDSLEEANDLLGPIKALIKQADSIFDPIIKANHEAHKQAIAQKRVVTAPLVAAEKAIKTSVSSYMAEVKRRQAEERLQAEEQARQRAEEQRLAEALRMEENGNTEAAEAILEAPVTAPVVVRNEKPAMPQGLTSKTIWKARITDPRLLAEHIVTKAPELLYIVSFSQRDLDSMARRQHELLNLPGVEAYSEEQIVKR